VNLDMPLPAEHACGMWHPLRTITVYFLAWWAAQQWGNCIWSNNYRAWTTSNWLVCSLAWL